MQGEAQGGRKSAQHTPISLSLSLRSLSHTHIHTPTHNRPTEVSIYIYTYTYTRGATSTCETGRAQKVTLRSCSGSRGRTSSHACQLTYIHTYIHTCHTYIHTYIQSYIDTHAYRHTQLRVASAGRRGCRRRYRSMCGSDGHGRHAMRCNAMRCDAMRCDAMQAETHDGEGESGQGKGRGWMNTRARARGHAGQADARDRCLVSRGTAGESDPIGTPGELVEVRM